MIRILERVMLCDHCRFHVGGPADHFALVRDREGLGEALLFARRNELPYFVFGGGSNIFFDDAGFRGVAVRLQDGALLVDQTAHRTSVSAGYDLPSLVRELAAQGLGGIEFLGNVPGSTGGAVVGNAGCYGKALADVLVSAELLDAASGEFFEAPPAFFDFAYRESKLKHTDGYVVVGAVLQLTPRDKDQVLAEIEAELDVRLHKHPHESWCAGSFFKNPGRDIPAWRLITDAGMAGARAGGAVMSPMHANFLVNEGRATSADIIALAKRVQSRVQEVCGCWLTPEVRYVGPSGIVEL
jgi:UDP-N-acetylmuramate dehydrogenase